MAELTLDHVEGHPLAGHLDGMGVAQLVWKRESGHETSLVEQLRCG